MDRPAAAISPLVRDVIISAQADGGCATVSGVPCRSAVIAEGEGGGEHASLVAAAAKIDRHLAESTPSLLSWDYRSTAAMPIHLVAAARIRNRQLLLQRSWLTNGEAGLRAAVAACQQVWGIRRLDAPMANPSMGHAAPSAAPCPFEFHTLFEVPLKRSAIMRFMRNDATNRRLRHASPREVATISSLRDQSINEYVAGQP